MCVCVFKDLDQFVAIKCPLRQVETESLKRRDSGKI